MPRSIRSFLPLFSVRTRLLLASILTFTILILACGDDATATPTSTTAAPTSTATQPAATASPTTAAPTATTAAPTATATTPAAGVPVSPRLRVAVPPAAQQFTMQHRMQQTSARIMPIYDYLVGRNHETNVEGPALATSWSVQPDGKTWNFELREGIPYYRDGSPTDLTFNADDVLLLVGLLTGNLSENTVSPGTWAGRFGTDETRWVKVNDHEVRFDLPFINTDMSFLLSDEWEVGIPSKAHWDAVGGEEGYSADPIGSGPWSFMSLETNVGFVHERVEDHWRKTPEFHEFQGLFVAEAATRLAMILNNEAHIVAIPRDLRQAAIDGGMVISKSTLPGSHTHLRIPYYKPESYVDPVTGETPSGGRTGPTPLFDPNSPMRKREVRLALNYAINREEINDVFFKGEGFPLVDYFPPWREDFLDEWAPYPNKTGRTGKEGGWPYPYDPDGARELLAQAGYPNGFETELWFTPTSPTVPEQGEIMEAIAEYWDAIGVRTRLVPFNGSLTVKARQVENHNWAFFSAPSLDPICVAPSFWWWEGGVGYLEYDEISNFKKACDASPDPQERIRLAQDFARWWIDNGTSVPLVWVFHEAAVNPSVVADYTVNMLHMGPIRYHEYTEAVMQ